MLFFGFLSGSIYARIGYTKYGGKEAKRELQRGVHYRP